MARCFDPWPILPAFSYLSVFKSEKRSRGTSSSISFVSSHRSTAKIGSACRVVKPQLVTRKTPVRSIAVVYLWFFNHDVCNSDYFLFDFSTNLATFLSYFLSYLTTFSSGIVSLLIK